MRKLLIANRGEIACRLLRTARRMGIATVAVYTPPDTWAPHVAQADEAYAVGDYMNREQLMDVAARSHADALHPGYGFLSEKGDLARDCQRHGVLFVGPSPDVLDTMGQKSRAKALMEKAGIPTTPGYHGDDQSSETLKEAAEKLGYPVLIKASAGGGGRGMRAVHASEAFMEALASCRREALSLFGDKRVLLEKLLLEPRHIEVQIFGDQHGHVVHLFERECSLQRRHQKVIEESPAPGLSPTLRGCLQEMAIQATQAVHYVGAGTVEFIVEGEKAFFMEMNTRLQVEHPVTEMVTGLDLVEWQIRVARGEALPSQDSLTRSGHAIEARVCAEDPLHDFLPSAGPLEEATWPRDPWVRVETGLGRDVGLEYDSLLAKVIAHGSTREEARCRLVQALHATSLPGPKTNLTFLQNLLTHEEFREGRLHTHFISDHLEALLKVGREEHHLLALGVLWYHGAQQGGVRSWEDRKGWRLWDCETVTYHFFSHGESVPVTLRFHEGVTVTCPSCELDVTLWQQTPEGLRAIYEGKSVLIRARRRGETLMLSGMGAHVRASREREAYGQEVKAEGTLTSPMPGHVMKVLVGVGETVQEGDVLVVLEAMKMEHTITSPVKGSVEEVYFQEGASVKEGDVLVSVAREH